MRFAVGGKRNWAPRFDGFVMLMEIDTDPCGLCDYAPAFCDCDIECCMRFGKPAPEDYRWEQLEKSVNKGVFK